MSKKEIKGSRPIPYSLSQYGSCREVLYRCASCGAAFGILGNQTDFCHKCGKKQDWSDSPTFCSNSFREAYHTLFNKNAMFGGGREIDKELTKLMYQFYKGEFR